MAKVNDPKDKGNNSEGLNSNFYYEPLLIKINDKYIRKLISIIIQIKSYLKKIKKNVLKLNT